MVTRPSRLRPRQLRRFLGARRRPRRRPRPNLASAGRPHPRCLLRRSFSGRRFELPRRRLSAAAPRHPSSAAASRRPEPPRPQFLRPRSLPRPAELCSAISSATCSASAVGSAVASSTASATTASASSCGPAAGSSAAPSRRPQRPRPSWRALRRAPWPFCPARPSSDCCGPRARGCRRHRGNAARGPTAARRRSANARCGRRRASRAPANPSPAAGCRCRPSR